MSFAGHVLDMIARDRYNRALRRSYRNRHNRIKEAYQSELTNYQLGARGLSEMDRQEIRSKIRATIRKENRRSIIRTSIITIIVAVIIFYFLISIVFGKGG